MTAAYFSRTRATWREPPVSDPLLTTVSTVVMLTSSQRGKHIKALLHCTATEQPNLPEGSLRPHIRPSGSGAFLLGLEMEQHDEFPFRVASSNVPQIIWSTI
ncbi:hypothetical protein CTA1_6007 [Colletotrichum tanaceti]|uniref:Uncharacterized protein n=1 Tax=Colletotrichum tanaceti TaxID=1306861 RepID=A0A4U6X5F8_9PEZI|nr:hypothetical protein CTA1_6007 [Colletotrichum tanaceti]